MAYRDEYDLDVMGLRYSSVYGPRRATDCAIRTMIEDAMAKRPTKLYWGAGEFWPFVYVTDIVTATAAALDAPKTPAICRQCRRPGHARSAAHCRAGGRTFPNADIELGSNPRHDKRGRFDLSAAARDLTDPGMGYRTWRAGLYRLVSETRPCLSPCPAPQFAPTLCAMMIRTAIRLLAFDLPTRRNRVGMRPVATGHGIEEVAGGDGRR